MPRINLLLGITVILLVVTFQKSSNLAAAYGIAVTGNMLVTTTLLFFVMRRLWKWSLPVVLVPIIGFAVVDLMFFSANLVKVHQGGWASI
ncbi:KUP/HAK/KT family potassium transporter, partial [Ochrobactrum sp. SFR4]